VDAEHERGLPSLLGAASPPTGTARWIPRWRAHQLDAIDLRTRLHLAPTPTFTLRFALPEHANTLGRLPTRVALTDPPGFRHLERTHRLPWAFPLPLSGVEVLAELLPRDDRHGF
jgi:hypothetical protein